MIRMLGDAASPVALFAIGAVLWRSQQAAQGKTPVAHYAADGGDQAGRASPARVRCRQPRHELGTAARRVRAHRAGAGRRPAIGEQCLLLAERFRADNGRIARIILWSTALAFLSFSLTVRLMGAKAIA